MKKYALIIKKIILGIVILAATPMVGQNTGYFTFIPNAKGDIDLDGFEIGYYTVFDQWDLNNDGDISETEFYRVLFKRLDTNGDKSISPKEWVKARKYLSAPKDNNTIQNIEFTSLDSEKDKTLSSSEFLTGMQNTELFRSYDRDGDGNLNRKELNTMVYDLMDLDGNGFIGKGEFDRVKYLYMD